MAPNDDRATLIALCDLLKISLANGAVARDECGDWMIAGKNGHIYVDDTGFLFYLRCTNRPARWTNAKKLLAQHWVVQDGEDEGCIHLQGPTKKDAAIIRKYLGVRKRRPPPPPETVDRLRAYQFQSPASER